MIKKDEFKVVVMGGGTGTYVVISGLKRYPLKITAIVTVADSGGSTGRLRDEFGFLPVGDLRQSLAALAEENHQSWIRDLLLYRFSHGEGLQGHNLGNLILTSLQDMVGSTPKALEIAARIFRLEGNIYPVTTQRVDLVVEYADGSFVIGEHHLNPDEVGGKKIRQIRLSPRAKLYEKSRKSIEASDMIVIGPGDLYASILPNLVVSGVKQAFAKTKATIVYIVNLMTRYTQTHNFKASDHVAEAEAYLGRKSDYVIVNSGKIPKTALRLYQKENEFPVVNDLSDNTYKIITDNFASVASDQKQKGDEVRRSLLRHNRDKLAKILMRIVEERQ